MDREWARGVHTVYIESVSMPTLLKMKKEAKTGKKRVMSVRA
jgi:hypothetical protein